MASLSIRNIDPELKAEAIEIMKQHGMTARATVESFLRRLVHDHGQSEDTCFCHDLELNDETRKDLLKAKAGKTKYSVCKNAGEAFEKLGI